MGKRDLILIIGALVAALILGGMVLRNLSQEPALSGRNE